MGCCTWALSGSADKTIRLCDVENGNLIHVFEGHTERVNSVAFSPEGKRFLSGAADNTLRWWDIPMKKEIHRFDQPAAVLGVAFSPDGRLAVSCGADATVRLLGMPAPVGPKPD